MRKSRTFPGLLSNFLVFKEAFPDISRASGHSKNESIGSLRKRGYAHYLIIYFSLLSIRELLLTQKTEF